MLLELLALALLLELLALALLLELLDWVKELLCGMVDRMVYVRSSTVKYLEMSFKKKTKKKSPSFPPSIFEKNVKSWFRLRSWLRPGFDRESNRGHAGASITVSHLMYSYVSCWRSRSCTLILVFGCLF